MRRSLKRLMSLALCTAIIAAAIPTATAFAAEGPGNSDENVVTKSSEETAEESEISSDTEVSEETYETAEDSDLSDIPEEADVTNAISGGMVAMIRSTGYPTVQAAIDAAKTVDMSSSLATGDTITMIADTTENISNNKKITLNLNGHTLNGTGSGAVITNTGIFTLEDSVGTGKVTGGNGDEGGGVANLGSGRFYMNSGTITGNTARDGAGVHNRGIFYFNGGSITDNHATSNGGGIWETAAYTCALYLKDGVISENKADKSGGGIYVAYYLNSTNGHSSINWDNITNPDDAVNPRVINNSAGERGGGIYLDQFSGITLDKTTIYGNTADIEGADLYTDQHVQVYFPLVGSMNIEGFTGIGVYEDWSGSRYADSNEPVEYRESDKFSIDHKTDGNDWYIQTPSYSAVVAYGYNLTLEENDGTGKADNLFIDLSKNGKSNTLPGADHYGKTVDRDNCFTWNTKADGTGTTYMPGDIPDLATLGGDITFYAQYDHDWVRSTETVSGVEYTVDTCSKCGQVIKTASMSSELSEVISADYTMTNDITLSSSLVIPKNTEVILDLNGHTLKGSGNGSVIINNGTLTVTDSSESGTGLITGGVSRHGGGIDSSGDLTIKGGTISGNKATLSAARSASSLNTALTVDGGGIYSSGSLTIDGGTVSGNSAESGGGIYNAGDFTMNGGNITGNTAKAESAGSSVAGYGGGVYLSEAGHTFTMNGGSIEDNTAGGNGGGVYAAKAFNMNGGDIRDNTATEGGGVYLTQNINLTMNDGVISGNSAESGGGIRFENTDSTVKGAVFANTAEKQGADIYLALSQSTDDSSNLRLYFSADMGDDAYRISGWYYDKSGARYADSGNTTQVTFTDGEAVISTKTRAETYSLVSAYAAK